MSAQAPGSEATMKAIVYRRYGSPDVLQLQDVPKPVPTDDQVLVRVRAVSVNPLDWRALRGEPLFFRLSIGVRRPKRNIPGVDVAGVVEAVGPNVTRFRPGDEVFGEKSRGCAEYVAAAEGLFAQKPANLTLVEAAAIPAAGVTALQALRDKGIQPGTRVLINGASGGVGTFAVQIAKAMGAEVTGVCSTPNVDLVRSLGADHVIDYTSEDFTRSGGRYDVIMDNVGNRSLRSLRRVLAPKGTIVMVGAPKGRFILGTMALMLGAGLVSRFMGGQRIVSHLTDTQAEDLIAMTELIEAGKVRPIIDRCYPLSETADALRYLETLHARAKVVITV